MVALIDENTPNVEIGQRVSVGDERGTVKYIGPVPNTRGIWLGIDWDDSTRGKHNGTYDGILYFTARCETSGSLVRIEKVNFGQSIISGVQDRYGGDSKTLDSNVVREVERATNAPFLMMVGFEKVAKMQSFDMLKVVDLREHFINGAGELGKFGEMCPSIQELHLGSNLINCWRTVIDITLQLPELKFVDLSENRLKENDEEVEKLQNSMDKISHLVLSRMEYDWIDIMKYSKIWPNVQKLQLSYNNITAIDFLPINSFQNLTMLNIAGNNIMDWSEILKLGMLPQLEILNASATGISKINFPSPNNLFKRLKFILLSRNYINNWESLNELEKLPLLNELMFRDNPILNDVDRQTARQIIIARVSKLKILNGQEVPDEERRGAEYDYLKQNGKFWIDSNNNIQRRQDFIKLHPRYPALVKKYGQLDESFFESRSLALKNNLISLKLVHEEKCLIKKVPSIMAVQKLVSLCQKLFRTGSIMPTLTLCGIQNPLIKIVFDNLLKPLNFYSVEDGDTVLVDW